MRLPIAGAAKLDNYLYIATVDRLTIWDVSDPIVPKLLGASPSPSQDLKIGSDTSSPNGDGYMWNAGNTGYKKGKFYAKVGSTDYCKSDLSRVITR